MLILHRIRRNSSDPKNVYSFLTVIQRLAPFARPYWIWIICSLSVTAAGAIVMQVPPLTVRFIIDNLTSAVSHDGLNSHGASMLAGGGIALILAQALCLVVEFAQRYLGERLKCRIGADLANAAYARVITLDTAFHETQGNDVGALVQHIDRGIDSLSRIVKNVLIDVFPVCTTAAVALAVMFSVNWMMGLIATAVVPVYLLLSYKQASLQRGVRAHLQEMRVARSRGMYGTLAAIKVVQSYVRELYELDRHATINRDLVRTEIQHHSVNHIFDAVKSFTNELGATAIILTSSVLVLDGRLSVGAVMLNLMLYRNVTAPIRDLHRMYDESQEAVDTSAGFFGLMDARPIVCSPEVVRNNGTILGSVEFRDVVFSYVPGVPVLHGINMSFHPGKMIALVGLSMAGKSTIANLIPRFYDPDSGQVLIDGLDTREYSLDMLRSHVGLVSQELHVIDGTILENIRYGNLEASNEQVLAAVNRAGLDKVVAGKKLGLHTPARELSGGGKQRLSIARAFLKNPPILILDEPTASLDAIATRDIMQALEELCVGRTVVVISHNVAHFIAADEIFVVKNGNIVEQGTHASLYARGGQYASIINSTMQSLRVHHRIPAAS